MNRDELYELAGALCNGTMTPEQHERLQSVLASDPEARRFYFNYLDLHLGLRQLHLGAEAAQPLFQMKRDLDRLAPPARKRGFPTAAKFYGLAAGLFLCIAVFLARVGDRETEASPVATLLQSAGARFYGMAAGLRAGDAIVPNREHALREGRVEVRFRNGAIAILQGPAVFVVKDADRMLVNFGKCSVLVEEGAEGFVLETPLTEVVDLGTRFAIDVDEAGGTEIQVLDGETEVRRGTGKPTRLREGDAVKYAVAGSETVPFNKTGFPLDMPDRVVRYTATQRPETGGAEDLTSVTVRRGGKDYTYEVDQLIGIKLIHFKGVGYEGNYISTVTAGADPDRDDDPVTTRHALLDGDRNLNTGVINPGGSKTPLTRDPVMNDPEDPRRRNTPGMAIRFLRPVLNGPGPDAVMFEFQPVIQPEHGDPFHVSPLKFAPGLRSHTVMQWDLGTFSPEALRIGGFRLNGFAKSSSTLTELEHDRIQGGVDYGVTSKALAVGLDFSDLGYLEGASVEGLFFQDKLDQGHRIDPVFIAGLPPVERK